MLKGAGVNVVLHTAYQNDAILFFSQSKAAGFDTTIILGAGGGYSLADTAKAVGPDMNGVFDLDFPQASINPDGADRKRTRLNSSHSCAPRMPSSACNKKYKHLR